MMRSKKNGNMGILEIFLIALSVVAISTIIMFLNKSEKTYKEGRETVKEQFERTFEE